MQKDISLRTIAWVENAMRTSKTQDQYAFRLNWLTNLRAAWHHQQTELATGVIIDENA